MDVIENLDKYQTRFKNWNGGERLGSYPWVENKHTPLTPLRRALPMLNLGVISLAGAYIDGTEPFDLDSRDGDAGFHEIPVEVEASDLRYAAKGFETAAVEKDRNTQVPIERLREYEANACGIEEWAP